MPRSDLLRRDFALDDDGDPIEYVHVPKTKKPPKGALSGVDPHTKQTYHYRKIKLPGFG